MKRQKSFIASKNITIFLNPTSQKMRISHPEGPHFLHQRPTSSIRKQNMPHGTPNGQPIATLTFKQHPQSPISNRVLQQWINVTSQPCSPKPARLIELGGSKEKREMANSHLSVETQAVESSEGWARKVALLEGRVKQLHLQKQELGVQLNKRLRILEVENQRLVQSIRDYQNGKSSSSTVNEEFDLQEELSHQINVNLQLREQLQELTAEVESSRHQLELQKKEISNLGEEKAELKLQLLQLQDSSADQITSLNSQLQHLEVSLQKKDQNYRVILEEREKRVLELEEDNYSAQARLQEKEHLCQNLQKEVQSLTQDQATALGEIEHLHGKVSELERSSECKKCKELMHTVFRLNSQLNKK